MLTRRWPFLLALGFMLLTCGKKVDENILSTRAYDVSKIKSSRDNSGYRNYFKKMGINLTEVEAIYDSADSDAIILKLTVSNHKAVEKLISRIWDGEIPTDELKKIDSLFD